MNPLPSRPTIAERLAAIDALLNQFDAALAEAARASKAIRAILAGEPRPPRYLTAEEAARHVAARLGATGDEDDGGPLFDGPVTTKAGLDKAYEQAAQGDGEAAEMCDSTMPLRYGGTIACTLDDGHYGAHSAISGTRRWHGHGDDARHEDGTRILDGYRIADEVREQEEVAQLSIAPGESAGPASLASVQVQVQADGSVTAERPPTGYVAIPQEELRGARIGGQQ